VHSTVTAANHQPAALGPGALRCLCVAPRAFAPPWAVPAGAPQVRPQRGRWVGHARGAVLPLSMGLRLTPTALTRSVPQQPEPRGRPAWAVLTGQTRQPGPWGKGANGSRAGGAPAACAPPCIQLVPPLGSLSIRPQAAPVCAPLVLIRATYGGHLLQKTMRLAQHVGYIISQKEVCW